MSFWPTMILEWSPTTPPSSEVPVWVDITSRLYEWEWQYGRNDETGDFEAGNGHVILNNRDRAFDPLNTAGAWFGNIKPRRKFRMRATWNAVTYPVFLAHARGFPQQYVSETDIRVRIELADAVALLNDVDLVAVGFNRPVERSDQRLGALLDEADIPLAERDLDTGTVLVPASSDSDVLGSAQQHATEVADSEGVPVYVSRGGFTRVV